MTSLNDLEFRDAFIKRHIGPDAKQQAAMLAAVNASSLDDLTQKIVPESILLAHPLTLENATPEPEALAYLRAIAEQNKAFKSYIGMGYHDTFVPSVILRNVFENPGWYTAYTPYQPEIAQGRLEALINYQQMIIDLTGMDLANASLLDEATAAAEAMAMAKRSVRKNKSTGFFVDHNVHPQTLDVLRTRAEYYGFEIISGDLTTLHEHDVFGALIQYPGTDGRIDDPEPYIQHLHSQDALAIVASDLMALCVLKSPGEMGADVVLGNSQRFGVPMGFGGPHAAFFATRECYKRAIPGRIIGVSKDSAGNQAYRMALQTREQHIRREKATSNICTAQVLLANMAGFYAVYHGPDGLKRIAQRIHRLTGILAEGLEAKGIRVVNSHFFDTLTIDPLHNVDLILERAGAHSVNFRRYQNDNLGISINETTTREDIEELFDVLLGEHDLNASVMDADLTHQNTTFIPENLERTQPYLTHPVFNSYHSETDMLRYLKKLENRDLALDHSMIALGSCTMKLNAATQMIPVSWEKFGRMHPFAPDNQTKGYRTLVDELQTMLKAITGFAAVSLQPNSGAQGEYAGLLAIRKYQEAMGEGDRDICLIPQSAHGTNPASAQMMGLQVLVVKTDVYGNVDQQDLQAKVDQAGDRLSCLMITYPSTHGVFEQGIKEICELIHQRGGQVYMDGANLNAQVGVTRPADIGADVSHMNLHKTFAIPHGGGGPGMGPIGVGAHLAPFLPNHTVAPIPGGNPLMGAVSATPYGSASILTISWMYIRLLGANGLRESTQVALLNANYLVTRLKDYYPILYSAENGLVAHECILDLRPMKAESGISEVDMAKRLMDYGFHAPTMSFPVPGTFMVEPTESESKVELDRFADAMIAIYHEVQQVITGHFPADNNPLVNAPHTQKDLIGDWQRPYSREQAAFPLAWIADNKFWPSVNRIDDVWGDRNLFCACPPTDSYSET
ncbi:MAG: aminomethyl-transferring glycine dehydrogenase [Reinekea forsetii]|jgi:glycine dehydrogenase|uniref:Glycine dehydrogenase (decarboxylating) n=2 Tax=Reinekea TaxID=230494 RepID=A0A2K8KR84_9GAMM|nr:aminomethyl-transferring glycine dehydrogenase [Reinekea forsetii]ATX77240.1 glycine dehydrogenase [decarboxylating] (glycine cleavage system P protein) [Reinekea forsetii]MDO7646054.1 aminomethyl-transferring glycine dehydrogenase [Reinekea forsetii]MDO7675039.1 aminomethyl-transferring glycine dehydrogenase [Reinekea forsetii]